MSSLNEAIKTLEEDLTSTPLRIALHHDRPFAILRYDPDQEWTLRTEIRLLQTRLAEVGKQAHLISLAKLMWTAIEESEGKDTLFQLEAAAGFEKAQAQVSLYLSRPEFCRLRDVLVKELEGKDPTVDVAFLYRAGALAPAAYPLSKLLGELHGVSQVPVVLCYPGTSDGGADLRFMGLAERNSMGDYRVKVYG